MKTITFTEFLDSDYEEVRSESWRHGRRVQYLVREHDGFYLTEFMDVHHDDGIQNFSGKVNMHEAVQVMEPVWKIVK